MPDQPAHRTTDQRLMDLEIKATFAEDQIEQLDAVIVRQQMQIDNLNAQIGQLRESQKNAATSTQGDSSGMLRSDLPPHF
jgi:SlyX protein